MTSPSSSSSSKATSKAKASPTARAAATIPAHVLDHLLDLLVGCGDLPPSFHTTSVADPSLVTEAYLVAKLRSTLHTHGHVPFHQLTSLLHVSQQTADHILDLALGESQGSILFVDSFVVTQAGYKSLERQLVDLVTHGPLGGVANADTLASATSTSTGLVYLVLDKPHLSDTIRRDSIDTSVYYSSTFASELAAKLADTLANASEPTDIKRILTLTGCPAGLWQSTLHSLTPTLHGRLSNYLYMPTSYLASQLDQFRSLLATAGYIPLATIPPSILPQLVAASDNVPWSLSSVLISAWHAKALKDTVKALAQEATGQPDDLIVDVTGQAGSVLDPSDALAFVKSAFHSSSHSAYLTAGSKLAYRPLVIRTCFCLATDPIVTAALVAVPAGDAPTASASQVTRAMIAKPMTFLPAGMRDAIMPALLTHVQAAVDAALVYRSDPPLALAYWLARLTVYSTDLAKLGLPKPCVKALDRCMLRRVGPPLRDALVVLMPEGGDEAARVAALVTQAVEVKSASVVRKVVETVARAHVIGVPCGEEVEAERRAMRDEIVRCAEEWGRGQSVEEDEDDERARGEWWWVAKRLVVERDAVVWLGPSVPEEVVRAVADKAFAAVEHGAS